MKDSRRVLSLRPRSPQWATPLLFASALAIGAVVEAPRGVAELSLNGSSIAIEYGRPTLGGRDLLADAVPGTVWRLGADRSTTLTVSGAAVFGNMVAREGEYSLFLKRTSESSWALIINTQTGQWGTEHDPVRDILGIPLKWETQDEPVELLTIALEPETDETGILSIAWGHELLRQRFRLPPAAARDPAE